MADIDPVKLARIEPRLQKEANIWLSTTRKDGRPHLIPIWFVWLNEKLWIATPEGTQKHVNIAANPYVSVALEDGNSPVVIEGLAEVIQDKTVLTEVNAAFMEKFNWNVLKDKDARNVFVAIKPEKLLHWETG